MTTTQIPADNGVNVEALLGVREALAGTPKIARFQWRSVVSWVNGTHSRSDVETFYDPRADRRADRPRPSAGRPGRGPQAT
jgi:hypothetical protein